MNLENVTAELRPRGDWEAVDFGVRMVRRDAGPIYKVWFAVTLPMLALTVAAIHWTDYAGLALFLYWWFEPVTDGPILRMISRRLFGESADVAAALRATPALAFRNKLYLFTPYRFHFARSAALPVTQLEGLTGRARRARSKVLNLRTFNYGMGVTVAYQHLFTALYLGILLLAFALIPASYQGDVGERWVDRLFLDSDPMASTVSLLAIYVAQSALHPWFVGAGFGLYINCRTRLEAWDIEVAFRRIIQRRAGLAAAALAGLLVLPLAILPVDAPAQQAGDDAGYGDPGIEGYWSDEEIAPALEAVFAHEDLRTSQETTRWRSTSEPRTREASSGTDWWIELIESIGRFVAFLVEFGLWILLALLLLLLYATRDRWLPYLKAMPRPDRRPRRITLAGGELRAEDLPDDIPSAVVELLRSGRKREALSLLYRGSVFAAVMRYGVRLPPSATEGQCVDAVDDQAGDTPSEFFRRVVAVWIRCAYGFREPEPSSVEALCREWDSHFGAPA